MKKMKFKVLVIFMLLVFMAIGGCAVFAAQEEALKVSNIYKDDTSNGRYIFYGPDGNNLYILNAVSWRQYFDPEVLAKVVTIDGVDYIRYTDWQLFWSRDVIDVNETYTEDELRLKFGEAYYKFMKGFEYSPGKFPFDSVVDTKNFSLYKEMKKYSDDASRGKVIIDKYMEEKDQNILDYVAQGNDKIEKLYDNLWKYLKLSSYTHVYTNAIEYENTKNEFFATWGHSEVVIKKNNKAIFSDYYETLKETVNFSGEAEVPVPDEEPGDDGVDYEENINNFWEDAFNWFAGVDKTGSGVTAGFLEGAKNIIKVLGNMIFIVVTAILGVKYIWGSADAKYSVKNSLFGLVVAAVVFYGWDSISNVIATVTDSTISNSIQGTSITIYTYILYFVNIVAIAGIIFIGVRYLMASAEGKSQLKMKLGPAFLGIIMVYATISFLNTILSIFLG